MPQVEHDRELAAAVADLDEQQSAEIHPNLDRFIRGLADGIATSRPLIGDGERHDG